MRYPNDLLSGLTVVRQGRSRAVTAENPTGKKGMGGQAAGPLGASRKGAPCIPLIRAGETKRIAEIEGPAVIEHIWMTVTEQTSVQNCFVLRDLILRIYWDGEENPSVECPLGDFFCCGFGKAYCVNSLPIVVNPRGGFNCYFQMPFNRSAKIDIENQNEEDVPGFYYQIDYCEYRERIEDTAFFHAGWRREKITRKGEDFVILNGVKGRGQYVGTFLALSALERYWWGEGEVKFFLDDDDTYPTICGTGTEDYFGGAWSFGGKEQGETVEQTFQTPFLGYPYLSRKDDTVSDDYHMNDCPTMRALYRFHIPDPIRFERNLKVTLQQIGSCHRGLFERQDDIAATAYWYQSEPHAPFRRLPERMERWPR